MTDDNEARRAVSERCGVDILPERDEFDADYVRPRSLGDLMATEGARMRAKAEEEAGARFKHQVLGEWVEPRVSSNPHADGGLTDRARAAATSGVDSAQHSAQLSTPPSAHDWESVGSGLGDFLHTYCTRCRIPLVPVPAPLGWARTDWRAARAATHPCTPKPKES